MCFLSGKWQSVSQWGLVFGFEFRFGLLCGAACLSGSGTGKAIAVDCVSLVACLLFVYVCKGVISF